MSEALPDLTDAPPRGSWVLDTAAPGSSYLRRSAELPARHFRYGEPIFWWHGGLAMLLNGNLRALDGRGRPHDVLATGFDARDLDQVSGDPTGDHFLLSDGTTTFRWDFGRLTVIPGEWTQPQW